jgi:PQQ-dependent catabolism-associated CXXCW motif protein
MASAATYETQEFKTLLGQFFSRFDAVFAVLVLAALLFINLPASARADESYKDPPPAADAKPSPEIEGYKLSDYRDPVPATLKGARVISRAEAEDLWAKKGAVFIDVYPKSPKPENLPEGTIWREPQHQSIEGAVWLPNVGYGVLAPPVEEYLKKSLEKLSGGDKAKPMMFFCSKNCWMSWNTAKRTMTYGYTNVLWFPDGVDGWQEIGYPVFNVKAFEQ